jgi:hypothetical protein
MIVETFALGETNVTAHQHQRLDPAALERLLPTQQILNQARQVADHVHLKVTSDVAKFSLERRKV